VTLLLCGEPKVLSQPLLYLSLYLKRNRDGYYDRLQRVRTEGAWEEWLSFFLRGVIEVAGTATDTTRRIVQMIERDRARIETEAGRAAGSALRVHHLIVREIALTIPQATARLALSEPTVANAISHLERLGMVREVTGRQRGRLYIYDEYLAILSEGTEP
jgi:Fic family protein